MSTLTIDARVLDDMELPDLFGYFLLKVTPRPSYSWKGAYCYLLPFLPLK